MPKPAARRIISWPMLPTPSRPSVRPYSPRAFEYSFLFQRPGAQLGDVVGNAAIERQHQRERQLGDGDRVLARAVRHVDAALRRGRRRRSCCSRRRRGRSATSRPASSIGAGDLACRARRARRRRSSRSPASAPRPSGRARRRPRSRRPSGRRCRSVSNLSAIENLHRPISCQRQIDVNQQPVPQLRLEPGRLRRHDPAGVRDRHQVVDASPGYSENATAALPESTACSSAVGAARAADEIDPLVGAHVADAAGSARARAAAGARRRGALAREPSSRRRQPTGPACTSVPSRYIETSPLPRGRRGAVGAPAPRCAAPPGTRPASRPPRSFTVRL